MIRPFRGHQLPALSGRYIYILSAQGVPTLLRTLSFPFSRRIKRLLSERLVRPVPARPRPLPRSRGCHRLPAAPPFWRNHVHRWALLQFLAPLYNEAFSVTLDESHVGQTCF